MGLNLALIITLFILFFSILQGWRKGILGIVFGLVSWIFVIAFVVFAHPYIENYLRDNTKTYDTIYEKTQEHLEKRINENQAAQGIEQWWDSLTQGLPRQTIDNMKTDLKIDFGDKEYLDADLLESKKQQMVDELAVKISDFILQGISVLIAFLIAQILVGIVGGIVKAVGRIPVINGINGFFGLIAGAVEGFLVIWVLMYLVACASGTTIGQGIAMDIADSKFLTYLYDHNLLMSIISTL